MAHLKRSIVQVKTKEYCLAHTLFIAGARVKNDPNYQAYRKRRKILPKVSEQLQTSGFDLSREGGISELRDFQRNLSQYRILVYPGQQSENIMFDGQVATSQRINRLHVGQHYQVIKNLTAAVAKRYVCPPLTRAAREAHNTGAMRR